MESQAEKRIWRLFVTIPHEIKTHLLDIVVESGFQMMLGKSLLDTG
jgi:hypothetical protein